MNEFHAIFFLIWLCFILFGLVLTIFWVWAIIDCATKEPSEGNDKLVWILVIIFASWIGALVYVLVRRPKRIQDFGR
jgi:hypothetical protein